ncbi:MAG: hypothetical protein JWP74_2911 [Marmoricola sp.]|nr:hypothetical protein [Marmoricola sp.]
MWQTTNSTELANVIITERVRRASRQRRARQAKQSRKDV